MVREQLEDNALFLFLYFALRIYSWYKPGPWWNVPRTSCSSNVQFVFKSAFNMLIRKTKFGANVWSLQKETFRLWKIPLKTYFHIKLCLANTNTCDANFRSLSPSVFSLFCRHIHSLTMLAMQFYTYYINLLVCNRVWLQHKTGRSVQCIICYSLQYKMIPPQKFGL